MTLTIEYPEGLEMAVSMTKEELEAQIPLMAALKMFELGKLSSGKVAELAGISRVEVVGPQVVQQGAHPFQCAQVCYNRGYVTSE
jgi:hypothetical protein